ncbi:MAG: hypothetical protein HC770_01620, partial [Pseudanabaena sp. CRU_2_10]|nr:hypothetical protein [Pseudanabaena sp. CRU_2_10]
MAEASLFEHIPEGDQLEIEGCEITLHDPHVKYWEEKDLWINQRLDELLDQAYDIVVITTGHKDY